MALAVFDNAPSYAFIVKIDGIAVPSVNEVSGLKIEVDKIDLKQQTEDGKYIVRQVIGRHKAGEITVTRGLTDSKTVTDWLKQVMEGDMAGSRKTATVEVLDFAGAPIKTFNYTNCWVRSIEMSGLKAGATEQATEKFVICYDEVTVA